MLLCLYTASPYIQHWKTNCHSVPLLRIFSLSNASLHVSFPSYLAFSIFSVPCVFLLTFLSFVCAPFCALFFLPSRLPFSFSSAPRIFAGRRVAFVPDGELTRLRVQIMSNRITQYGKHANTSLVFLFGVKHSATATFFHLWIGFTRVNDIRWSPFSWLSLGLLLLTPYLFASRQFAKRSILVLPLAPNTHGEGYFAYDEVLCLLRLTLVSMLIKSTRTHIHKRHMVSKVAFINDDLRVNNKSSSKGQL